MPTTTSTTSTTSTTTPAPPLTFAEELVQRYTGLSLYPNVYRDLISGGDEEYVLRYGPITAGTTPVVMEACGTATYDVCYVENEGGRILMTERLLKGRYTVDYEAGYVTIPLALQDIIAKITLDIAALMTAGGYRSESINEYSYTLGDPQISIVIAPYRAALDLFVRY